MYMPESEFAVVKVISIMIGKIVTFLHTKDTHHINTTNCRIIVEEQIPSSPSIILADCTLPCSF